MSEESGDGQPVRTEGSLSASLRDQSDRVWEGLHAHPFLRELSRGVLPLEKFRFFIEQDLLYLPEFARCIAMGAAKSRTETELRYFTAQLQGTLGMEIPNQQRVLGRLLELGAEDRAGALGMAPANVAYTSYLKAVAALEGPWRSWPPCCPVPGAMWRSPSGWQVSAPIILSTRTGLAFT